MRLTIERLRTLVVVAAVLLVAAIGLFLGLARFRHRFLRRDLPERLGIDIQQEANGVTYTQNHGGHAIFKIHASRVIQLKNNHATLHDVVIELYGKQSGQIDRIRGAEFEYDQSTSIATAAGPVEIELDDATVGGQPAAPGRVVHVRTSGITFNQKTGVVTTAQRVQFSSGPLSGSSIGARYDSDLGFLVLDSQVELISARAANPVTVHAAHAEFSRDTRLCTLNQATADSGGRQATAAVARVVFRSDGSIDSLDASGGLTVSSQDGSRIAAPTGSIQFNASGQPRHAHLQDGVVMDDDVPGRTLHGVSPSMDLDFTAAGRLRHAHLERNVVFTSLEVTAQGASPVRIARSWRSPVADLEFRSTANGQVEPASLDGTGGVTVTSDTQRPSAAAVPARLFADHLTIAFGPRSALRSMQGLGHAEIDETTATGARQTASGDRLDALFAGANATAAPASAGNPRRKPGKPSPPASMLTGVQSATLDGHVVLIDTPPGRPSAQASAPIRATAGHALFETTGSPSAPQQWLHLTVSPRAVSDGMEISADKIDIDQTSGDAFARGNVKATWTRANSAAPTPFAGGAPVHAVAAEAQLRQATQDTTFRGHARLWQDQDSIAAPVIVLNRQARTLFAQGSAAEPVRAILLDPGTAPGPARPAAGAAPPARAPSLIRIRGGSLRYNDATRKSEVRAAPLANVVAQSATVESVSDQLDVYLVPASPHAAAPPGAAASQIDRVVATGHVTLSSEGRRGFGTRLVYTASTGNYELTGTAAAPPRMTDPVRGTVTGEALLFNSRNDSVTIEGGARPTTTQTTAPR